MHCHHLVFRSTLNIKRGLLIDSRDMYYEKWGFMLIFWNLAGVPLSYCHCTIYLANHAPSVYHWNRFALILLYATYLFVYWVWDTANSQKNRFRQEERGTPSERKAFPQLPWQTVKNPKKIDTDTGDSLLVDGWCTYTALPPPVTVLRALRRTCSQDTLHMRLVFRIKLGTHHWVPKSVPVVLSPLLCSYDFPSGTSRHPALRSQVWRILARL